MSKHLGNVLEPIPLMDEHGADAVRWFMAAGGSPWQARRVGHARDPGGRPQDAADLLEHRRRSSPSTPARPAGQPCVTPAPAIARAPGARPLGAVRGAPAGARGRRGARGVRHPARRPAARRRSSTTCPTGTSAGRAGGSGPATPPPSRRCTSACTSSPCCWRRSPRSSPSGCGRTSFASTSDQLPESVHLAAWPSVDGALVDDDAGRRRSRWSAGWSSSAAPPGPDSGVKTRQPLGRALVAARRLGRAARTSCAAQRRRGAQRRASVDELGGAGGELVDVHGRRPTSGRWASGSARRTPDVAAAIAAADAAALAAALRDRRGDRRRRRRSRSRSRPRTSSSPRRRARAGRSRPTAARPSRSTSTLTPELRRAGLARDVVRLRPGGAQDAAASRSPTGSSCAGRADGERRRGAARARAAVGRRGAGDHVRRGRLVDRGRTAAQTDVRRPDHDAETGLELLVQDGRRAKGRTGIRADIGSRSSLPDAPGGRRYSSGGRR